MPIDRLPGVLLHVVMCLPQHRPSPLQEEVVSARTAREQQWAAAEEMYGDDGEEYV